MPARADALAAELCAFLDAAPTPFHACVEVARRLEGAGFVRRTEAEPWKPGRGGARAFVQRGASLIGLPSTLQGLVSGSQGTELCNAFDVVFSTYE